MAIQSGRCQSVSRCVSGSRAKSCCRLLSRIPQECCCEAVGAGCDHFCGPISTRLLSLPKRAQQKSKDCGTLCCCAPVLRDVEAARAFYPILPEGLLLSALRHDAAAAPWFQPTRSVNWCSGGVDEERLPHGTRLHAVEQWLGQSRCIAIL